MKKEDKRDSAKLAAAGGLLAVVGSGSKLNEDAAKYYLQKEKVILRSLRKRVNLFLVN